MMQIVRKQTHLRKRPSQLIHATASRRNLFRNATPSTSQLQPPPPRAIDRLPQDLEAFKTDPKPTKREERQKPSAYKIPVDKQKTDKTVTKKGKKQNK